MDAIEELARALCLADGVNPNEVNWMGDPDVPYGTISWQRWQEYEDEARLKLDTND